MKSWRHGEANLRDWRERPRRRVTVRELLEHGYQVVATDRARAALGFVPQHSWREHVTPRSS